MTNLLSGLAVFIIHIVIIFISPKLPGVANTNTASWWYSVLLSLITVLYVYFGYQTFDKERRRLAGAIFFILALITAFTILMSNATY